MPAIAHSDIQTFQQRLSYYCRRAMTMEKPPHQDHQVEAHKAVIGKFGQMHQPKDFWSLQVMATGSGKSFTAGKQIKALNTPVGAQQPVWDYPTLIVTSRLYLTNQFKRELAQTIGVPENDIGIFSSKQRAKSQMNKPVLIVPYPTFRSLSKSGRLTPEMRPLLVLDESHNAIGYQAMTEIKNHWYEKSYISCWTATDKLKNKTVAKVLFNTDTGPDEDDATYRLPLKEAAERSITAPLKSMVLETQFSSGAKPSAEGYFSAEAEEKIVNQKGRMEALIRLCSGQYTKDFGVDFCGMKTIVFAPGIGHGRKLAKQFNKVFGSGYAVAVNGEDTPHSELDRHQEGSLAWRFCRGDTTQGDPTVIITDKLVAEGVDLPQAELAVEEVPTFSEREETQRVGRVTRYLQDKAAYSVVMLDKDQEGAAIIGEMEGWELKPKNFIFPTASRKKLSSPVNIPADYPDIDVRVIANAKEIAEFSNRRQDLKRNTELPKGFLRSEELGRMIQAVRPGASISIASYIFKEIANQLKTKDVADFQGIPVPKEAMREYYYNNRLSRCLRRDICEAIVAKYAAIKDKPAKGFVGAEEFGKMILAVKPSLKSAPASLGSGITQAIRQQLNTSDTAEYKTVPISRDALDEYRHNGASESSYALRLEECKAIAARYAATKDAPSKGFLRGEELLEMIRAVRPDISPSRGVAIITDIREQLRKNETAQHKGVPVTRDALDEYEYKGGTCYALNQVKCEDIVAVYAKEVSGAEPGPDSEAAGSASKWADDKLKNVSQPSSIAPDGVHERPGSGSEIVP